MTGAGRPIVLRSSRDSDTAARTLDGRDSEPSALINLAFGDWLRTMSPVPRTFVLATIAVPIVTYGSMPRLHRLRVRLLAGGRVGCGPGGGGGHDLLRSS